MKESRERGMNDSSVSPRNGLYNTFNEAELSEYLMFITCPICEEVVHCQLSPYVPFLHRQDVSVELERSQC